VTTRRFEGRRALVTGASRGIGAGVAERLAAEGAAVAITARTLTRHDHLAGSLDETAERLRQYGVRVAVVVADLTAPQDRARLVPEAVEGVGGPIDILVNNAAASMHQPPTGFSLRRQHITFEANVHAPLDLAQAVIPSMRDASRGWIVNVSSGAARPTPGPPFPDGVQASTIAVYGASKAALNRISNGLAAELAGSGIRVNTVEPRAAVLTDGAQAILGDRLRADQIESLEEMVEAVAALCDCPPDFTGQTTVSLDLIAGWGLAVHSLAGEPRSEPIH
jgi:NAD(P)-dependent dehydrogenase (short-subunit alcohol dehydrogenase family)